MLSKLKHYLCQEGMANVQELSQHLGVDDPGIVRAMMQRWLDKGRVRRFIKTPQCGTQCQQCAPASVECYEWIA